MKSRWMFLTASLLVLSPFAGAQEANAPTSTGETGLFTILTGQTVPKGKWSFGFYYNNWDRIAVDPFASTLGEQDPFGYDWNRVSASFGYGLTDNFEVSLMVPYEDLHGSESGRTAVVNGSLFLEDIDGKGLGNARLGGKWRFVGSSDSDNELGLNAFVEAPTGDEDEGVATGSTGFGTGLVWTYKRFSLNAGYHDPGDGPDFDVSPEALVALGYRHPFTENFDWITELVGTIYLDDEYGPDDDNADLTTGGRVFFGDHHRWALSFAARADLVQLGNEGNCPVGGLVGLTWFPRKEKEEEHHEEKREEVKVTPPPPLPPVPPPPAPKAEIREICTFDKGSRVDNICKATLDSVALKMKQDTSLRASIVGYSDTTGTTASQMKLSKDRADAVKAYLMSRHGIASSRISTDGKGNVGAGSSNNKRTEIILKSE